MSCHTGACAVCCKLAVSSYNMMHPILSHAMSDAIGEAVRGHGVMCCSGAPWADNASTEWLNSVLLELYRHGKLPVKPSESSYARVGGRQGADRSVERATDAEPGQLLQLK